MGWPDNPVEVQCGARTGIICPTAAVPLSHTAAGTDDAEEIFTDVSAAADMFSCSGQARVSM